MSVLVRIGVVEKFLVFNFEDFLFCGGLFVFFKLVVFFLEIELVKGYFLLIFCIYFIVFE